MIGMLEQKHREAVMGNDNTFIKAATVSSICTSVCDSHIFYTFIYTYRVTLMNDFHAVVTEYTDAHDTTVT